MAFTIKNPPEFSLEIEQWTRETKADGERMAKVPEALLNNEVYLKAELERQRTEMLAVVLVMSYDREKKALQLSYAGNVLPDLSAGSVFALPVATQSRLGGVKIGNGLDVEMDGTLSINAAEAVEEVIATEDDTVEMMKEIFGD